jgi:hypothetical protein
LSSRSRILPFSSLLTPQSSLPSVRFEPIIPASDRLQNLSLHRSATGLDRIRTPRPNESLHRLSYPGPPTLTKSQNRQQRRGMMFPRACAGGRQNGVLW